MSKFCGKCGNPIGDYDMFCPNCGANQTVAAPSVNNQYMAGNTLNVTKRKITPLIIAIPIIMIAIISTIVIVIIQSGKSGFRNPETLFNTYRDGVIEGNGEDLIKCVPDEAKKHIMLEYSITEQQLISRVEPAYSFVGALADSVCLKTYAIGKAKYKCQTSIDSYDIQNINNHIYDYIGAIPEEVVAIEFDPSVNSRDEDEISNENINRQVGDALGRYEYDSASEREYFITYIFKYKGRWYSYDAMTELNYIANPYEYY